MTITYGAENGAKIDNYKIHSMFSLPFTSIGPKCLVILPFLGNCSFPVSTVTGKQSTEKKPSEPPGSQT